MSAARVREQNRVKHAEYVLPGPTPLFVQSWSPPSDPQAVVLMVHGLGEHSGRYAPLAELLAEAGYRVFAFDLRGHGRSHGRRGDAPSYETLLDDLGRLVLECRIANESKPLILYGHSLGGNLVLNFVLRRPVDVRGLVISSPLLLPASSPPLWKRLAARGLYWVCPGVRFRSGVRAELLSHDPAAVAAYRADPLVHDLVSARLALEMLAAGRWALAHADELTVPALLLHGTADPITSCAASAELARRAGASCTFRAWPGLLHELHWESPRRQVMEEIAQWIPGLFDRAPAENPRK